MSDDSQDIIDYNGFGRWSRESILQRYAEYAAEMQTPIRDLNPRESTHGNRKWIYPVMQRVIEGIADGDAACIRIGIELIEEDSKLPFGKILKSKAARVLRRAQLTTDQKARIRSRVFGLLGAGHIPHEFRDYARLVRTVGYTARDLPDVDSDDRFVRHFVDYFKTALRQSR
jgi:hypothetical protein